MTQALATMGGTRTDGILSVPEDGDYETETAPSQVPAPVPVAKALIPQRRATDHPKRLNRHQKAAIIVRLLTDGDVDLPLEKLEQPNMARLTRAMGGLAYVDEATTLTVVHEFLGEFGSLALYFRSGIQGAMERLESYLSQETRRSLVSAPGPEIPNDPWRVLGGTDTDILVRVLSSETPQVNALALSKLPATRAAEVVSALPEAVARSAILAAARIDRITQKTVSEVGTALMGAATRLTRPGALPGTPVDRVGSILNFAPGARREDMLSGLQTADPALADQIRRVMFTFGDIPDRIEIKDVPKLVRAVDNDTLVTALAGSMTSQKDTVDFILANMSKRLADQLSEEVRDIGDVKPADADAAMNAVVAGIRTLEADGELTLISPEE